MKRTVLMALLALLSRDAWSAQGNEKLKVLLVTISTEPRIGRIKEFLGKNGFELSSVSYKDATPEQCKKFDLLIADSPNDEKGDGAVALKTNPMADHLPARDKPIICVGFLGTQVLKAHKVGLACGYI